MDLNDFAIWGMLKAELPEGGLEEIAEADYGMDREEHLVALAEIAQTGRPPVPLPWIPGEVLNLTKWSGGDVRTSSAAVVPLFCCVVLLAVAAERDGDEDFAQNAVIIAVHCATFLGRQWEDALLQFLASAGERVAGFSRQMGFPWDDLLVYPLACLLLVCHLDLDQRECEFWRRHILVETEWGSQWTQRPQCFWEPWGFFGYTQCRKLWRHYLAMCGSDVSGLGLPR